MTGPFQTSMVYFFAKINCVKDFERVFNRPVDGAVNSSSENDELFHVKCSWGSLILVIW